MSDLLAPIDTRPPLVQLTRQGTICGSSETLAQLRVQFSQQHYFRLPQLLEAELLDVVQKQIDSGEFYERVHEEIDSNKELCLRQNAASDALLFLINDEKLFEIIQQITGCGPIRCFDGRIYRANPGNGHHDSWHNDVGDDRLVGLTLNLAREEYSGGVLQLRERESGETIGEIANVRAGDAVVFRLARNLQHRISEVTGNAPKTAFAGWFKAQPHFSQFHRIAVTESSRG
ncbi:MAG TPA: 2OG-Fe(II) oxygenase [Pyrinomonadaceae bacterium]|jgi:hypothetical protein